MIAQPGVDYAYARVHACLGRHPGEPAWQRMEAARDLGAALDAARASAFFSTWTAGLSAYSDIHAVESRLRARFRALVAEVAGWMPARWHAACAWTGVLPDLPALYHLYHGGAPLAWMRGDPVLNAFLDPELAKRRHAMAGGGLAPLAAHWETPSALRSAWVAEWRRRLPRHADPALIGKLAAVIGEHLAAFPATAPEAAWAARAALRARLRHLLRAAVLHPAAAFAYLAIAALDVERLR
ncbi:MAG: hypothetical protein FJY54_18540, partial [Betaproteobacteria bacterium]|nr:hypothetical protein [Betaproteobacteria bacterium]